MWNPIINCTLLLLFVNSINCYLFIENVIGRMGEPKIFGGQKAEIQNIAYQAQLVLNGDQTCGATIISEYWLVSAAHCFQNSKKGFKILTGSKHRSKGEIHEIKRIVIHDNFNLGTFDNDISLIELTKPINFNKNQKAIPIAIRSPRVGDEVIISGFGRPNGQDVSSPVLREARVPVVDQTKCAQRHYPDVLTDNMFCAGKENIDACQGDSGGPAVINNKLAGVVSWGRYCATKYYDGVYTDVYGYRSWISEVTGNKLSSFLFFL